MTEEDAQGYGIIDDVISSREVAELRGDPSLLAGEPGRIAREADASPAEQPEA